MLFDSCYKMNFQKLAVVAGFLSAGLLSALPVRASVLVDPMIRRQNTQTVESEVISETSTEGSTQNLVEVASTTDGFSTLVTALQAANVGSVLTGEGPFTVFAPTDAAFAALPSGTLDALLQPTNRDLLVKLLYNHVAYGDVTSDQLSNGQLDTFDGDVAIGITPNGVMVDNANVIQADVDASNGVIHAVDQVLVPAGFTEQLQARINAPATATTTTTTTTGTQVTRADSLQESAIDRSTSVAPIEPETPETTTAAPAAAPEEPVRGLW